MVTKQLVPYKAREGLVAKSSLGETLANPAPAKNGRTRALRLRCWALPPSRPPEKGGGAPRPAARRTESKPGHFEEMTLYLGTADHMSNVS